MPAGSSPLARGLPARAADSRGRCRIIPARAGFTGPGTRPVRRPWDHPRSRGVYFLIPLHTVFRPGSSPLARGLPFQTAWIPVQSRIIPARAGFTGSRSTAGRRRPDHPRSRGVYPLDPRAAAFIAGSSPLARGLPLCQSTPITSSGIIPARAGFTTPTPSARCRPTDHPRSRGVYVAVADATVVAKGSSPLARGLLPRPRLL